MENLNIEQVAEKMGAKVHELWMAKRKAEKGWHSPEECSKRKQENNETAKSYELYCENCHTCMRPYSELPDSEKELARQYPQVFLDILREEGYKIIKAE